MAERRATLRCFAVLLLALAGRPGFLSASSPIGFSFRSPKVPNQVRSGVNAHGLERRLLELSRELKTRSADSDHAIYSLTITAAHLSRYAAKDPELARMMVDLKRMLEDQQAAVEPIIMKMTIIARRLQRYRETNKIAIDDTEGERFRDVIESPWVAWMPLPKLEFELSQLIKQIQRYKPEPAAAPAPLAAPAPIPPAAKPAAVPKKSLDEGPVNPHPVTALMELLSSHNPRLRALAADELRRFGASAGPAAPSLRNLLSDSDPRVRSSAVTALGAIKNVAPDIVAAMRRALDDKNEDVRISAKNALESLNHLKLP